MIISLVLGERQTFFLSIRPGTHPHTVTDVFVGSPYEFREEDVRVTKGVETKKKTGNK